MKVFIWTTSCYTNNIVVTSLWKNHSHCRIQHWLSFILMITSYIKPWGLPIPQFHRVCTLLESGVFVEMYDTCDVYIFWIGTTAEESDKGFKKFIFKEISQFIKLDECGVPVHPIAAQNTGNKYSQVVLHHLSIKQFSKITGHLTPHRTVFWGYWHWPQCMVAGPCLPPASLWSKRRAHPCQVHCYDLWHLQVPVGQKSRCGKVCGLSCST